MSLIDFLQTTTPKTYDPFFGKTVAEMSEAEFHDFILEQTFEEGLFLALVKAQPAWNYTLSQIARERINKNGGH